MEKEESVKTVSELVLGKAVANLGAIATGDPAPWWLHEAMGEAGIRTNAIPMDYYGFLQEAASCGRYVDPRFPQSGDIGILQRDSSDVYWSFVVETVRAHGMDVILAQSFHPGDETEVRRITISFPDVNATWHTIGLIRF